MFVANLKLPCKMLTFVSHFLCMYYIYAGFGDFYVKMNLNLQTEKYLNFIVGGQYELGLV